MNYQTTLKINYRIKSIKHVSHIEQDNVIYKVDQEHTIFPKKDTNESRLLQRNSSHLLHCNELPTKNDQLSIHDHHSANATFSLLVKNVYRPSKNLGREKVLGEFF